MFRRVLNFYTRFYAVTSVSEEADDSWYSQLSSYVPVVISNYVCIIM